LTLGEQSPRLAAIKKRKNIADVAEQLSDWITPRIGMEYGTHKTVKARLRPRLSGKCPEHLWNCSLFARK
jgi:hypothetical protein